MNKKIRTFTNKISYNAGLKIFSLVSAFIIWIVVVNNIDPIKTAEITDIPVTILNRESLTDKNLVPAVVYGNEIDITIKARKSICDKITRDSIKALVDCEKIYVTDTVPIEISFDGYDENEIEIIRGQNQYMKLSLEEYMTREFKISAETVGTPLAPYVVGSIVSSPNVISVTGSKTLVGRISYVAASVDVTDLSARTIVTVSPVIYDINGEIINTDNFTLTADSVRVTAEFYKTKEVKLNAATIGAPKNGYEVRGILFQPESVIFSGTDEDLTLLPDTLTVSVDVTDKNSAVESNIDIMSLISSDLSTINITDRDSVLAVTVLIEEAPEAAIDEEIDTNPDNTGGDESADTTPGDTENHDDTGIYSDDPFNAKNTDTNSSDTDTHKNQ